MRRLLKSHEMTWSGMIFQGRVDFSQRVEQLTYPLGYPSPTMMLSMWSFQTMDLPLHWSHFFFVCFSYFFVVYPPELCQVFLSRNAEQIYLSQIVRSQEEMCRRGVIKHWFDGRPVSSNMAGKSLKWIFILMYLAYLDENSFNQMGILFIAIFDYQRVRWFHLALLAGKSLQL